MKAVEKYRRSQTLPRHTNLAPLSRRTGAFFIDLAISALITIIFSVFVFQNVFANEMNTRQARLYEYDFNSHLFVYDEVNQQRKNLSIADYNDPHADDTYKNALKYYYCNYLTGVDAEIPEGTSKPYEFFIAPNYNEVVEGSTLLPKDYYTIEWFNSNILDITDISDEPNSSAYFKYDVDAEGHVDKTKIGVRRSTRYSSDLGKVTEVTMKETCDVLYEKYRTTYIEHLCQQPFYLSKLNEISLFTGICWVISIFIAVLAIYIIVPMFLTNYATPGKKIMKLGLANYEGYKVKKYQLIFRALPCLLTSALVFLVPLPSYYIAISIVFVMLMASIGLAAASPKRCSIHDYCGRTIVIDTPTTIIFDNELEEEEYCNAEDGVNQES